MASKFRLQIAPEKRSKTWNSEKALADALAERALFLETYPKYKPFQKEINKMLDKAGSSENRMAVLAVLMEAKLLELQKELRHLNSILLSMSDKEPPPKRSTRLTSSN
jgi:bacterioferritin (cytochrome b1)